MWIWFVVAGVCSGIIAGMGMGGGTILIPVLTLLLGVKQKNAQSINLLVFIPTAIIALIIHLKNKLVDYKTGLIVASSGVLLSIVGAMLATTISNESLRLYFGIFLLFVGVFQLVDSIIQLFSKSKLPANKLVKTKLNIFKIKK